MLAYNYNTLSLDNFLFPGDLLAALFLLVIFPLFFIVFHSSAPSSTNIGRSRRLIRRSAALLSKIYNQSQPDPEDDPTSRRQKRFLRWIFTSLLYFHYGAFFIHPGMEPQSSWPLIQGLSRLLQDYVLVATVGWSSCLLLGWITGFAFDNTTILLSTGFLWCAIELFGRDPKDPEV